MSKRQKSTLVFEAFAKDGKITKDVFAKFCLQALRYDLSTAETDRVFDSMVKLEGGHLTLKEWLESSARNKFLEGTVENYICRKQMEDFKVSREYDYSKPTKEIYKAEITGISEDDFHGPYAAARGMVNHSFHGNYSKERQEWQNMIIGSVCVRTQPQRKPWFIFMCGSPGAGKGHTMRWLSQQGYFQFEEIVHIDPDFFKMSMPEWPGYQKHGETSIDKVCGAEANMMADVAQFEAINQRQTILRDGTLSNGDFYRGEFQRLRRDFPEYKIAVVHVTADEPTIKQRIEDRARETGRTVDDWYWRQCIERIPASLEKVSKLVDVLATFDNSCYQTTPMLRGVNGSRPEDINAPVAFLWHPRLQLNESCVCVVRSPLCT